MSLRFFCDHCVPREIVESLRQGGHEVLLLRDHLPLRSPDAAVIAKAREWQCVLVSLNGDFADIAAYPPANYGGIIAIEVHNHPEIIPALLCEDVSQPGRSERQAACISTRLRRPIRIGCGHGPDAHCAVGACRSGQAAIG
ncbi:MAG: DUF5615 family PIN-like protein [Planctomycetota bacterium]|nr:DUF5615 family PIN-like protein [Planctomycetota bacterium]